MFLERRNPARELVSFRDMIDRLFEEGRPWGSLETPSLLTGGVPLDIVDDGQNLVVKASTPGVKTDDLHVEISDDTLRIWGEHKADKERKEEEYYLREQHHGRFERSTRLPYPVQADKAKAELEDGVLTLTLPKDSESQRREIRIKGKR